MKEFDEKFLALALRLARRELGQTGTNPSVGSIIVRNRSDTGAFEIVGVGHTQPGGRPHAEAVALNNAGSKARHATLYTTLDPCTHQGKSPPCISAIINSGISRVASLSFDNNPQVAGESEAKLRKAGIRFDRFGGWLKSRADYLNLGHSLRFSEKRPFVQLKLAVGDDGRMARGDGAPVWVTARLARQLGHLMRSEVDAILVGRQTVEADNPELTCRLPGLEARSPIRIVLDSGLRLSETSRLVKSARSTPLWIFHSKHADDKKIRQLSGLGVETMSCNVSPRGGGVDLSDVMTKLFEKGITRLLVEGGPMVLQSFVESGYTDEVVIFKGKISPGADGIVPFKGAGLSYFRNSAQFERVEDRRIGEDLITRYLRKSVKRAF